MATAEDQITAALELVKQVIGSQRPNSWNDQVSMTSIRVCLENALTTLDKELEDAKEEGIRLADEGRGLYW